MKTPDEYEAELIDSVPDMRNRYRIATYLATLQTLARALGAERTQQIHSRAGLLIKSYAETTEEKP